MRFVLTAFAAFAAFCAAPAHAQKIVEEARFGVLAQSCCGYAVDKEQGVSVNGEIVFASPDFLDFLGAPQPVIGVAIATDSDATSQLYTGLNWRFDITRALYAAVGGGGVIHNGETDQFDPAVDMNRITNTHFYGCRVLFHVTADLGVRLTEHVDAEIHWSHMSNASLCGDNEALDHLGLRLGWRF